MNQGHKLVFGAFHSDKNVNLLWNVVGGKWWSEWARGCTRCYFMQRKTGDFDFARNLIFGNWELLLHDYFLQACLLFTANMCVCAHEHIHTINGTDCFKKHIYTSESRKAVYWKIHNHYSLVHKPSFSHAHDKYLTTIHYHS